MTQRPSLVGDLCVGLRPCWMTFLSILAKAAWHLFPFEVALTLPLLSAQLVTLGAPRSLVCWRAIHRLSTNWVSRSFSADAKRKNSNPTQLRW